MRSHELTIGRTFGVAFDHGEDFYTALTEFCRANDVQQGYIPTFIAGFAEAKIVGTCQELEDPKAPVWSHVYLTNVEAHGSGTVAYNADKQAIEPHIHVSIGLKEQSATGYTSHLLSARVQFLTEMIFVEVVEPRMRRTPDADLYSVPLLGFLNGSSTG
ncbi:MAG: PPC domain-containing DNA-binding protein [Micromonosporaceae bacterium]